jgi:hypothetical protein
LRWIRYTSLSWLLALPLSMVFSCSLSSRIISLRRSDRVSRNVKKSLKSVASRLRENTIHLSWFSTLIIMWV